MAKSEKAKEAQRKRMKRWREENREKVREYQRAWREQNAEHVKAYNATYMPEYYQREGAAKSRWKRNLKAYDLTPSDFNAMWQEQEGKCAICQHEMLPRGRTKDAAAVDHNHATGEVRGLLCRGCNHGIGNLKDDPEILRRAAEYLEEKGHYAHLKRLVK